MSRTSRKPSLSKLSLSKAAVWAAACGAGGISTPKVKWPVKQYKIFLLWTSLLFLAVFVDSSMMHPSGLRRYLQTLKWTPLPVGVGFALIAFQQYRHTRRREAAKLGVCDPCELLADQWEIQAYKLLPLRSVSRTWGWLTGLELPEWTRNTVLGYYVRAFGCNMAEAEVEDLNKYKCLSEFFRRRLKMDARPIDSTAGVVSPADGTVLYGGKVNCGMLEQVKGVSYSAKRFLGPNCWSEGGPTVLTRDDESCFHVSCLRNPRRNELYHAAIYLAPGDYHRFHSPANWAVFFRRHFPGELLSVNPSIAAWIRELFVLNERVCYVGEWEHGFFSMTAVGATNVGSIVVPFDHDLRTNARRGIYTKVSFVDRYFEEHELISKSKGEDFGEFNLGSTIVLIFEAPKNANICFEPGQKVKVGQPLLRIEPVSSSTSSSSDHKGVTP